MGAAIDIVAIVVVVGIICSIIADGVVVVDGSSADACEGTRFDF